MFNRDIEKLVEGEEVVKEKETRLYNKLREEFKAWIYVLTVNTHKGKSRDSAPKAESCTPRPGATSRSQKVSEEPAPGIHTRPRHRRKAPRPPQLPPRPRSLLFTPHPRPSENGLAPPGSSTCRPAPAQMHGAHACVRVRVCAHAHACAYLCETPLLTSVLDKNSTKGYCHPAVTLSDLQMRQE